VRHDLLAALLATLSAFGLGVVLAPAFGAICAAGRLPDHRPVRLAATVVVDFVPRDPAADPDPSKS
jgi:glutamate transport system permease protein